MTVIKSIFLSAQQDPGQENIYFEFQKQSLLESLLDNDLADGEHIREKTIYPNKKILGQTVECRQSFSEFYTKFCRAVTSCVTVLILGDNLEIGAHVRSNLCCYLVCERHLIRSCAVNKGFFFSPKIYILLYSCAIRFELPYNISTMSCVVCIWLQNIG